MEENPAHPLNDRQRLQVEEYKQIVDTFGQFDQSSGANGAHYAPADANPFKEQGLMCSSCVFFEGGNGCELVAGDIQPEAVCKLWVIPDNLITASRKGTKPVELTFSAHVTASNVESRTLTGQIVPFGVPGNTSAGPVVFEPLAFSSIQPDKVKLLLEHDNRRPIGKMLAYEVTPAGITATFKVAETTAGSDALIEASTALRDGFSVGAQINQHTIKDGTIVVSSATLIETSLVTDPAYGEFTRVSQVAASEHADDSQENPTETVEETEMTEQPVEVAAEVEASKVEASTSAPIFTSPRLAPLTGAKYLEHSIQAALGSDESRMIVRAADDSTSTNTGLTLPQHLNEFVTNTISDRPAIAAVSRQALVSSGMTFTVPKLQTAPTVAATSEGSAPSETGMTSDYLTGTVVKYAGSNDVSFELIDRSSPEFYAELMLQLQNAYAKATDTAVLTALAASGTQASTQAGTAAGFIAYAGKESAACFAASKKKARNLVINTDWWGTLLGAADTTGRPLFTASNAQNNPGVQSVDSLEGNIMGLNTYVDPYVAASGLVDDSAFIIAPEAVTWYESGTTRLQVQMIETGQLRVGIYGYGSVLVKEATGIRRFNLT